MLFKPSLTGQSGFSLIELMAATLVLGLSIVGVVTMLGTGQGLEYNSDLRRQARLRVTTVLDDSLYHHTRHNSTYSYPAISSDPSIFLDSGTANPVSAILQVRLFPETVAWQDSVNGAIYSVPYQRMRVSLIWTVDGRTDSVFMTKRIPRL